MWIVEGLEETIVRLEYQERIWDFPREVFSSPRVGQILTLEQQQGWFRFVEQPMNVLEAQNELDELNGDAPEGDLQL